MKTLRDYISIIESQLSEAPADPRTQAEFDSQMAAVKSAYKDAQDAEQQPAQTTAQAAQPAPADGQRQPNTVYQGQNPSIDDATRAAAQQAVAQAGQQPAAEPTTQAAQSATPAAPKQSFSKSVQDIAKASGIADPNKIKVGQKIKLPNGGEYTVAAGDTLGAIAAGKFKGTPPAAPQAAQPAAPKTPDEERGFDPAETKQITDLQAQIAAEKDPTKKSQLNQELVKLAQKFSPNVVARAQANQQAAAAQQTATAGANAALARAADNAIAKQPAAQTAANLATGAVQTAQATATPATDVNTGVAKPTVVAQPGQTTTQQTTTQKGNINPTTAANIARLQQLAGQVPKTTTTSTSTAADGTKTTTTRSSGQATMIAGKPVTPGQPLDQNQLAAIQAGVMMGNKYDPAIMAQFQKQRSAQPTQQGAQPAQKADF